VGTRALTDVRLGAQGIETGTRGTLYFDDFESRRFSYIGTLTDPGVDDPQATNAAGWFARMYQYSASIPHAVVSVTSEQSAVDSYEYDLNGNMTCRIEGGITFKQDYNAENRISAIHKMNGNCSTGSVTESWLYAYDGMGTRVTTAHYTGVTLDSMTLYYMGGMYEVTGSAVKKYYSIAGQTVAMNDGSGLKYLLTDHLGSTNVVVDSNGSLLSQQRYLPFGEVRAIPNSPIIQTDFGYTGQRNLSGTGLMDYKFRMYSPALGRFISPDSIIPNPVNPQAWNRFSYTGNNPIRFNDPTGHRCEPGDYEPGGYCYSSSRSIAPPPQGISYEHDKKLRTLRLKAEILSESLQSGEMNDLEVLEELFNYAANAYGDDVDTAIMDLGIVVGGMDTTGDIPRPIAEGDPNDPLSQYYIGYAAFVPEQTAFSNRLNVNNENQIRHFLAGVAGSYAARGFGELGMYGDEFCDMFVRCGGGGGTSEDLRLYARAFDFVHFLRGNPAYRIPGHPLSEAGAWVRENLGP
jgi:RHS repeat-associated protein